MGYSKRWKLQYFFKKNNSSSISKLFMNIIKNFSIADEKVGICLSPGLNSQLIKLRLEKLQKNKIFHNWF